MSYSRRSRYDDTLFIAVLVIPAIVAGTCYLQSESRIDQIASLNKTPAAVADNVLARTATADASNLTRKRF